MSTARTFGKFYGSRNHDSRIPPAARWNSRGGAPVQVKRMVA
ncbi:MAG TPA: hypothetical protein VIR81_13565 [Myxococcales bacterium]